MTITSDSELAWRAQPRAARVYVAAVMVSGAIALGLAAPHAMPDPALFLFLLLTVCVTSAWKVNLPIAMARGRVQVEGSIGSLLKLLPYTRGLYPTYVQSLKSAGRTDLLVA